MVYKEKVQSLLDSLDGKLRVLDNVAAGVMQLPHNTVVEIIKDSIKIKERITELISIER